MKYLYLVLCILGTIIPYASFVPFLAQNGLNLSLFARQMFATPVAAFFSVDVILASLALWAFIYFETRKRTIKLWPLSILANLLVGISLALPLFLLLREIAIKEQK